ncbi:MAG: DUF2207 domain-containing protein [Candidatus Parcubacteria bacterium]|nr:DUF2207 domain-containing protein [Candidatus Parcubacteria bacterium]
MIIRKQIYLALIVFFVFCFGSLEVLGRENVDYWYIKNFEMEMKVNTDSSILITEKILADCGQAVDKHGIFRVVPTVTKIPNKTIKTPIKLISIMDFDGKSLKYKTIKDSMHDTITWQIGDANVNVSGENGYQITYLTKNALLTDNPDFDELYRNLNGNFWDIPTDNFKVRIIFPEGFKKDNSHISYYTGYLGDENQDLAKYEWITDNVLEFTSLGILEPGEGITASVSFPKGLIQKYQSTFFEKYADYFPYLIFLLPLILLIICFRLWSKYGRDIAWRKVVIAEFDIPFDLNPIEMGVFLNNGNLGKNIIPAGIVSLAVRKIITIEEVPGQFIIKYRDWKLKLLIDKEEVEKLALPEKLLIKEIFSPLSKKEVLISDLKHFKFNEKASQIKDQLVKDGFMDKKAFSYQGLMGGGIALVVVAFFLSAFIFRDLLIQIYPALIISFFILILFNILMPKRTEKGAELAWKISGFKLYMNVAEKYRQRFYEQENIFEKLLPYAILFGMTKQWINKMKIIYGQEYVNSYHPVWFVMAAGSNFNSFDSLNSAISNISTSISSSVGSRSGASGGGFSGGGGGGGGGGGW